MPTQNEKLAASLAAVQAVQQDGVIRAAKLPRTHRERLLKAGFLQEVIKGWLIVISPATQDRSSVSWYASFWSFVAQYLQQRFQDDYCLSPDASLRRYVESTVVPAHVVVMTRRRINQVVKLPFDTSLLVYREVTAFPAEREHRDGLSLMSLPEALCRVDPGFFRKEPTDAAIALRQIRDPSSLLRILLKSGNSVVAGRLAGAYARLSNTEFCERIVDAMKAAGYTVRVSDPFENTIPIADQKSVHEAPAAARIHDLWMRMRPEIARIFPAAPGLPSDGETYLAQVEERYSNDAYNSLSIEGYRVTPELIEQVRKGNWNPHGTDDQQQNALAARGYYHAFQSVERSLEKILRGDNASTVVARDHQRWYQEMFAPVVQAGIIERAQLAGYRNQPVYLRGSRHVPPRVEAVLDCLDVLWELLKTEEHAGVQAVLGHFFFVYIHPYPDGNGRIGRFLMNALLAGGGYPWTVIREKRRRQYLDALEAASSHNDIVPFTRFVMKEMTDV